MFVGKRQYGSWRVQLVVLSLEVVEGMKEWVGSVMGVGWWR